MKLSDNVRNVFALLLFIAVPLLVFFAGLYTGKKIYSETRYVNSSSVGNICYAESRKLYGDYGGISQQEAIQAMVQRFQDQK